MSSAQRPPSFRGGNRGRVRNQTWRQVIRRGSCQPGPGCTREAAVGNPRSETHADTGRVPGSGPELHAHRWALSCPGSSQLPAFECCSATSLLCDRGRSLSPSGLFPVC